jgi:hypothetical protein
MIRENILAYIGKRNTMSLTLKGKGKKGRNVAYIKSGRRKGQMLKLLPVEDFGVVAASGEQADIKLEKGEEFQPIPFLKTDRIYISAPSEAGKSTWIGKYLKEKRRKNKDVPIYVFSRLEDDPNLETVDMDRVVLDDDVIENPIEPEELENSVCVFDDTDTIRHKGLNKAILALRDDLLETGRHKGCNVIICNHMVCSNQKTRVVINECTSVVLFPHAGGKNGIRYYLDKYMGLNKAQIQKILTVPSRWVMVAKTYPLFAIHERGAFMLV